MVFLLAVLLTAIASASGRRSIASVLSFLALQFLLHRAALHLHRRRAVRTAGAGDLSGRRGHHLPRWRAACASRRALRAKRMRAMRRLYEFTRRLSGLATLDAVAEGAASEIHASLARPVVVLLGAGRRSGAAAAWPPRGRARCRRHDGGALGLQPRRAGGRRYGDLADHPVVLRAAAHRRQDARRRSVSRRTRTRTPLDSEARALLDTLAEQTAAALDRASLAARWSARGPRPKPSACATRCWLRSRTISARRCRRSSARRPA